EATRSTLASAAIPGEAISVQTRNWIAKLGVMMRSRKTSATAVFRSREILSRAPRPPPRPRLAAAVSPPPWHDLHFPGRSCAPAARPGDVPSPLADHRLLAAPGISGRWLRPARAHLQAPAPLAP